MIHIEAPAREISAIGREPRREAIVALRPDWLSEGDGAITLRAPEIIYSRAMRDTYYIDHSAGGGFVALRERYVHIVPEWQTVEPERHLRYHVAVPGRCSFWSEVRADEDCAWITWGLRNEGRETIPDLMVQFCPCMDRCEPFRDATGERVFARRGGTFVRSAGIQREQGTPILHERQSDPADDIICLESVDGLHTIGVAWDVRPQHFLNNTALACIHTEPHMDSLAPGESQEVHGTFYCIAGDRHSLLERFRADWRS